MILPDDEAVPLGTDELPPPPTRKSARQESAPPPSDALAEYELGPEIGRGGMGVVYRARHRKLDRPVALKLILAGVYSAPEVRERFLIEARATARMTHPHIVQIHDIGEENGVLYMALELVEGPTLAQVLAANPLPQRQAAELCQMLAHAVSYAHSREVVHRDLKPANVMISGDGPKLTDFGIAKVLDGSESTIGQVAGTPSYMAPEQAAGGSVGPSVDVYALGAVMYECLTGRPPFRAASFAKTLQLVLDQPVVPPSRLQPDLSPDLNTICLKCLEKEPGRRYASVAALAEDLERFLQGRPIAARPVKRREHVQRWIRRHPADAALIGAMLAAVVLGVGGVTWQWRRAESQTVRTHDMYQLALQGQNKARQAGQIAETRRRELEQAIDTTAFLINSIDLDQLTHLRMLPLEKELLLPALEANKRFLRDHEHEPDREAEVVAAWYRVAMLTRITGSWSEALEVGMTALEHQQRFADANPDVAQYRRSLAASLQNVGYLLHALKRSEDGLAYLNKARRIRAEFVDAEPENLDYHSELGGCLNEIGLACWNLSDQKNDASMRAAAEQALRSAYDHQQLAVHKAPHVYRYQLMLSNHLFNRSRVIAKERPADAESMANELLTVLPNDPETKVRASRVLALVASVSGDPDVRLAHRACDLLEKLSDYPEQVEFAMRAPEFNGLHRYPEFRELGKKCPRWSSSYMAPRRVRADRQ